MFIRLIRLNWLNYTSMRKSYHVLKGFRNHQRPPQCPRLISGSLHQRTDPQCWESVKLLLQGKCLVSPAEPECILTHRTLCFTGFTHPQHIKIVTMSLTWEHHYCNNQAFPLDPLEVIFFLSSTYYYAFFFFLLFLIYFLKLYLYWFDIVIFLQISQKYSFFIILKIFLAFHKPLYAWKQLQFSQNVQQITFSFITAVCCHTL